MRLRRFRGRYIFYINFWDSVFLFGVRRDVLLVEFVDFILRLVFFGDNSFFIVIDEEVVIVLIFDCLIYSVYICFLYKIIF